MQEIIKHDSMNSLINQPIRVLEGDLINCINEVLCQICLENYKSKIAFDRKILTIKPSIVEEKNDSSILFPEGLQSFLWIWNYCLSVIFCEGKENNKEIDFNNSKAKLAYQLLEYGYSLIDSFSEWDLTLPNPQNLSGIEPQIKNNINTSYYYSVCIIILHEIGHLEEGHYETKNIPLFSNNLTPEDLKRFEYEADSFAIKEVTSNLAKIKNTQLWNFSLISSFSAIMVLQRELRLSPYPDIDERFKITVESLKLRDDDELWEMACLALKLWFKIKKRVCNVTLGKDTYRKLFYRILQTMEEIKSPNL